MATANFPDKKRAFLYETPFQEYVFRILISVSSFGVVTTATAVVTTAAAVAAAAERTTFAAFGFRTCHRNGNHFTLVLGLVELVNGSLAIVIAHFHKAKSA